MAHDRAAHDAALDDRSNRLGAHEHRCAHLDGVVGHHLIEFGAGPRTRAMGSRVLWPTQFEADAMGIARKRRNGGRGERIGEAHVIELLTALG